MGIFLTVSLLSAIPFPGHVRGGTLTINPMALNLYYSHRHYYIIGSLVKATLTLFLSTRASYHGTIGRGRIPVPTIIWLARMTPTLHGIAGRCNGTS